MRKLGCGFLFAFYSNYGSILYHFRDEERYWLKVAIFLIPPVIDALVRGIPSEYCTTVLYEKTRMVWLPDGEKSLMISLAVLTDYRRVTDGRTDRRTSCGGIVRAVIID